MAYESISVYKLNNSLNKIDNIKETRYENLSGKINTSEWSGKISKNIIKALDKEISEMQKIQKLISKYKVACEYIEEYKDLENSNKSYSNSLASYKKDLSYYNNELGSSKEKMQGFDSLTSDIEKSYTKTKIDYYNNKVSNASSNIADINSKIANTKIRMEKLKEKINNIIG